MAKALSSEAPAENRLLARLPRRDYERLLPRLQLVRLKFKQTLTEIDARIDWVYFPSSGVVSDVAILDDGKNIEVATIGNEGFIGFEAMLGAATWPSRMTVQVAGEARRMEVGVFVAETKKDGPVRELLARYHTTYVKQLGHSVACNGLHSVHQRCCRWLLMTHDRVAGDEFPMTHEFLSHMLGVRRVSVTDVLADLQKAGLIRSHRGSITILDREGMEDEACECYANWQKELARLLGS
jgi:CRP-like cAMP-binding protein